MCQCSSNVRKYSDSGTLVDHNVHFLDASATSSELMHSNRISWPLFDPLPLFVCVCLCAGYQLSAAVHPPSIHPAMALVYNHHLTKTIGIKGAGSSHEVKVGRPSHRLLHEKRGR